MELEPVQVVVSVQVLVQVELAQVVLVWNLRNQPLPIPRPTLKLILFLDPVP
jgi:hypothetical protein